jgi:FkbM family methyltransferase
MVRINKATLRSAVTTTMIRLGSRNAIGLVPVALKCRLLGATLTNEGEFLSLRRGNHEMWLAHRHFIYAPYLSSNFDVFFAPLVPFESNGRSVVDFSRSGNLQTYAKSGLQFEMASFPETEEAIEGYFRWHAPKSGDTIFDVGAHCGVSSYLFSKMVGDHGRVVAFEPDPVNYALLLRNIERHKLTNVIPLQIAISGTSGIEQFASEGTIGAALSRHSNHPAIGRSVMVETATLESAFQKWGQPQFCKIDIEGSELEVITVSRDLIRNHPCEFALDTGHKVGGSFTDKRIEALFRECGYEATSETMGEATTTWARPAS